jgi:hypothetical protein
MVTSRSPLIKSDLKIFIPRFSFDTPLHYYVISNEQHTQNQLFLKIHMGKNKHTLAIKIDILIVFDHF